MKWSVFKENLKTTKHKLQVMRFMLKVCLRLLKRAWVHDFSKYSKEEAPHFAAAGDTKDLVYDSPEYKQSLKNLEEALELVEKALSYAPQQPAYLDTKAEVLEKLGRFDEAKPIRDLLKGELP